jgi:hypothetical protein
MDGIQPEFSSPSPFFVKDCLLSTISTGEHAGTLIEFRDKLMTIHEGCIYHHFWGGHLRPMFVDPEYHNDFAAWAHHTLHDDILAERLGIIDPTEFDDLEQLRQAVLEVVEERLDEREVFYWSKKREHFHFVQSKIIIFSTPLQIATPLDLIKIVPIMSTHSIFYHFIDAKRRSPEGWDDFSIWLKSFGDEYTDLIHQLQSVDPYFFSLVELRKELIRIIKNYFIKDEYE